MLVAQLQSGRKLLVRFEHRLARFYPDGTVVESPASLCNVVVFGKDGKIAYKIRRATKCTIHEDRGEVKGVRVESKLVEAWAKCHPFDNFTRATGRKHALAAALKKSDLSQPNRMDVWFRYFTSTRNNPLAGQTLYEAWRVEHPSLVGK